MRKLSQDIAVGRMVAARPDFDYSQFVYNGSTAKGSVICHAHGVFMSDYQSIVAGHGCPRCKAANTSKNQTKDSKTAVAQMALAHPEYDFSKFIYSGNKVTSTVGCSAHGDFQASLSSIMRGRKCPACSVRSRTTLRTLDSNVAIARMKAAAPQLDFSEFIYKTSASKSSVVCAKHGAFKTTYNSIVGGVGCKRCSFETISVANRVPFREFVLRVNRIHADAYSYREETYTEMSGSVVAVCPKHGDFRVSCQEHERGQKCPSCKDVGFNPMKRGYLYIYRLHVNEVSYVGYGITGNIRRRSKEHEMRLSACGVKGELLHVFSFRRGYVCRDIETLLLNTFPSVNLDVRGFRKEATHWSHYTAVWSVVNSIHAERKSESVICVPKNKNPA